MIRHGRHGFDADDAIEQGRRVPMEVFHEFRFCGRWAGDENLLCFRKSRGDAAIEFRLSGEMRSGGAADRVVQMSRRMGGMHDRLFRSVGAEMDDSRFVMVDPDDGVVMSGQRMSPSSSQRAQGNKYVIAAPTPLIQVKRGLRRVNDKPREPDAKRA